MLYSPLVYIKYKGENPSDFGYNLNNWRRGLLFGLKWSLAFLLPLTPIAMIWTHGAAPYSTPPLHVMGSYISLAITASVSEEVFFRGFIQTLISRKFGDKIAIITTAALFASAHMLYHPNPLYLATFFPGLLMGWLRVKSESIMPSMLFHFLGNIWAIWFSPLF